MQATDARNAPDKKQKQLPPEARTYRILPNMPSETPSSSEEVEMEKPDNSKRKKKKIHLNPNDDEEKKDE